MLNKKNLFVLAVMINIIITFFSSVNLWADDAPAGDEYATIANSLPDALIILDLSGSMAFNSSGDDTYTYGADTSCTANTTVCQDPADANYYIYSHDDTCSLDAANCNGSPGTTYIYGADATCTANSNPGACISGATSTYKYAADNTCTANSTAGKCISGATSTYKYAADTSCVANSGSGKCTNSTNCTGGFCKVSKSGCSTDCSNSSGKYGYCSGGFCGTSKGGCATDCSNSSGKLGYCSGGFCGTSGKSGCSYDCNCKDGMCRNSRTTTCSNKCFTNVCTNGFCTPANGQSDCQTNCSKLAIAKRALFSILDDDNTGTIDANDMVSMGIRIGFMRFRNGDDTSGNYASGNNMLVDVISAITGGVSSNNQTSYSLTFCGNSTSCATPTNNSSCTTGECMVGETATGGTPLASSLKEAKTYLDAHKAGDAYKGCRQKFVIVLTDGADTYANGGNGQECQSNMYMRRREVVAATKQLADAGYKVFVVGFGATMPMYLQNTLNWMAWYGGTDNPLIADSGSKTAYNIPLGCFATPAVTSACCNLSTNASACFPSGITSGQSSADQSATCGGGSTSEFRATVNDPGFKNNGNTTDEITSVLSGYAFLAGDADSLTAALKSAIATIKEATYSFTHASIPAQRTTDENYLYEASFEPLATDSFWIGHLKRFTLATDGSISAASDWDAGTVLQAVSDDGVSSPRNIYTTDGSSSTLKTFTEDNLTNAILGVTTDSKRFYLIKFIRQGDYAYVTGDPLKNWKLGDILHVSPLSIPTPNSNFNDPVDTNPSNAYLTYLSYHTRTSAIGNRLILVGANDGQLHAFKTGNGSEAWSFIPPNLLPRLSYMTHGSHPTDLSHTYFVDGPLSAAEVWVPSGGYTSSTSAIGSTSKSYLDWHTYLVMSEGRGGISTLWSQYSSCSCPTTATNCGTTGTNPAFSSSYSSTYNDYCGFYALDLTETTTTIPATPTFKWNLGGTSGLSSSDKPEFLGQPWSKMYFGRVRINNNETFVGLIGGGYSGTNCAGTTACSDKRGKGFYVVDLSNGHILWSFTHDGSGNAGNVNMDYNLVAGPVAVDSDSDGFMDKAYIGDLGGNLWRFKFCLQSNGSSCSTTANPGWKGSLLFSKPSTVLKIYTSATITIDTSENYWVYFGTGDKTDPGSITSGQERLYAVKDSDGTSTYTLSNLMDISGTSATSYPVYDPNSTTYHGWYITLYGTAEKILAAPVVYDKKVYFTTYTPSSVACDQNGIARLYSINYLTGAGLFPNGARSMDIGYGIPAGAVISTNPYTGDYNVYVSTSAANYGTGSSTIMPGDPSVRSSKSKYRIYWKDNRLK